MRLGQLRKYRSDKFGIRLRKNTAFAAFTGFIRLGIGNCQACRAPDQERTTCRIDT
jgi:hypothetical protein